MRQVITNLVRTSGQSSPAAEYAAIDAMTGELYNNTLLSSSYGLVGDGNIGAKTGTDNNTAILAWIAAAQAIITAGGSVRMVLTPGIYFTTGRHVFPGAADVEFFSATLVASGTDETAPTFQHGTAAGQWTGRLSGIRIDSVVTHTWMNLNCCALRLTNKVGSHNQVAYVANHTKGVQFSAEDGSGGIGCTYNTLILDRVVQCTFSVECLNKGVNCFCSENTVIGGDAENGTSNDGSHYGLTFSNDWDTGHTDHSGNNWYNPSMQQGSVNSSWSSGGTRTVNIRYYTPSIGGEWLCAIGGVSGTVEPSIVPAFVLVTGITVTAGSAVVTMASTAGLSVGMHVKGTNPTDAFPINTSIQSVDSGTQLTLTQSCAATRNSTTYKGVFTTPTTDGAATLIYLGPYRKSAVWIRNCSLGNGLHDARWEASVGEAILVSGVHLWPESPSSELGNFRMTIRDISANTTVNRSIQPVWAATTAYALGSQVRPTLSNGTYWDVVTAGTSGGTEPASPPVTGGSTIADGSVVWKVRPYQLTALIGEYTGANTGGPNTIARIRCGYSSEASTATATVDALHLSAVGSAAGWCVKGLSKVAQTGLTPLSTFAAGDISLARDGILLNTNNILYGTYIRTDKAKYFVLRTHHGAYALGEGRMACYDHSFNLLTMTAAGNAYHRRYWGDYGYDVGTNCAKVQAPGGETLSHFMVNDEVGYVFIGFYKGNPFTLTGFSVTENPHSLVTNAVEFVNPWSSLKGPRRSLGTPTSGFFLEAGEYIDNASVVTGNTTPLGYVVTTPGILAPQWLTATAYIKGQLAIDSGHVYAANGAFTSGTVPSGTGANILDSTATSITAGDPATWDYMGPLAALTADVNLA